LLLLEEVGEIAVVACVGVGVAESRDDTGERRLIRLMRLMTVVGVCNLVEGGGVGGS
jgi:hypothetical protein